MTGQQKTGCSGKCRVESSRRKRKEKNLAALDEAERALRKVRRAAWVEEVGYDRET